MFPPPFRHLLLLTLLSLRPTITTSLPLEEEQTPLLHQPHLPHQPPLTPSPNTNTTLNISLPLFHSLEEHARLVDIAYCVGATGLGITRPFQCASRCADFPGFELVTTWNTGVLLSDSCGYVVLSHPPAGQPRIVVAFRGTYSVANTVVDLSTGRQEYVPYLGDSGGGGGDGGEGGCANCTVHAGFMKAWRETRPVVLPVLERLVQEYPGYEVTLVGHSLGGAIAALAALDFQARGWDPLVTTFGEPRVGNQGLVRFLDRAFAESDGEGRQEGRRYRRVTHVDDPVPLLPLTEWGYEMHGGEIFIEKPELSPEVGDLRLCEGDRDPRCIAGGEVEKPGARFPVEEQMVDVERFRDWMVETKGMLDVPPRWRIWQLFFAHRDYFWRLGLCLPGGDPHDWYRKYADSGKVKGGEL